MGGLRSSDTLGSTTASTSKTASVSASANVHQNVHQRIEKDRVGYVRIGSDSIENTLIIKVLHSDMDRNGCPTNDGIGIRSPRTRIRSSWLPGRGINPCGRGTVPLTRIAEWRDGHRFDNDRSPRAYRNRTRS
jgi:hypothetical protein